MARMPVTPPVQPAAPVSETRRTWTPEQFRTLISEATELAHMADVALRTGADFADLRISLAARRIAEIVMPQDLVHAPNH
jgi:hypothetical protein